MKFNIKSRKGFTLIELLVVIGILAVLAAIAIPSVAGLIDRANVSADKTNSNEMTNAMERFASEYELFCQDIASGTFDKDNMDAAQGRVYNVLGIEDRAGIELVEIDADEPVDDDAIAIYRDTKYPANAKTAQLIVQNYTKTSSSTFEPKQSDMHYWYSPDCGVIVYAEPDASLTPENIVNKLNAQVISGMDAKGNPLDENTEWIDLTEGVPPRIPAACGIEGHWENDKMDHSATTSCAKHEFNCQCDGWVIPEGGVYTIKRTSITYEAGMRLPCGYVTETYDEYVEGDYRYRVEYDNFQLNRYEWAAHVLDKTKTKYGEIRSQINNRDVMLLNNTFENCVNLLESPKIPNTITSMDSTFKGCVSLLHAPTLPKSVLYMDATFHTCTSLKTISNIPTNVKNMWATFANCAELTDVTGIVLPETLTDISWTFSNCTNLSGIITIHASPTETADYAGCFNGIDYKKQNITLIGNSNTLDIIGKSNTRNYCLDCNGSCNQEH